jgi:hypothetical protein
MSLRALGSRLGFGALPLCPQKTDIAWGARHVAKVPILLQFFGDERNFPGPLIHFVCGDVAQK